MPDHSTVHLLVAVIAGLAITQIVLIVLARGLGLRVSRTCIVTGLSLAAAPVVVFLAAHSILLPTDVIARNVPDAPPSNAAADYRVLNDAVYQFIPWEAEVRRAFAAGRLPLWSDLIDGGSSPWLNPQAGVLSPVFLVARLAPLEHHLLAALAIKLLIAFQGAWLLARVLGGRRGPALIAGFGFALGGAVMAWSLFAHSATAAWVPWLVAASIRTARRPVVGRVASTAVATAAMLLSGHPETALGGGILAAVGATCYGRRSAGLRGALAGVGAAAAAALLGFMLAAPHLLPFARHLPNTVRYQRLTEHASGHPAPHGWVDSRKARFLKSTASPQPYGWWPYSQGPFLPVGGGGYAGLTALAGAFLALAFRARRVVPLVVTGTAIGALVAEFRPLIALAHRLPLLESVEWTRLITVLPLCLAVGGAIGLSELMRRRRPVALTAVAAAAGVSLAVSPRPAVAVIWLGIGIATIVLLTRPKLATALLVAVTLADLAPWARAMLPMGDPRLFYPETRFMTTLEQRQTASGSPRATGLRFNVYPSMLAMYGAADIRYHNPVADHRYAQVLDAALRFHPVSQPYEYFSPVRTLPPLVDFLNLGLIVTGARDLPDRFTEVTTDAKGRHRLFENRQRLPRAFIPTGGVVVDAERTLEATASITDPRIVVVSRGEANGRQVPRSRWDPTAVGWTADGHGRVVMEVGGNGIRLVATSLTHRRGWRGRAGSQRLEIITVNHAFVGVVVPDGVKSVELGFTPPGFRTGVMIFLIGFIVLLGLVVTPVKRRRRE